MIYGVGGTSLPPIGRTTDDLKFSNLGGMGVMFRQGLHHNLGARSLRAAERRGLAPNVTKEALRNELSDITPFSEFEESMLTSAQISLMDKDVGRTYTVEEANAYNKDIEKTYKAPQSQAGLDWDRKNHEAQVKRNNELARIQSGVLPKTLAFVGGIGAAMVDPPNLALMLIPSAPQVKLALAARRAKIGLTAAQKSGKLIKAGKVAVPRGASLVAGSKASDFAFGALEGVAFGATTEIPNYVLAHELQEEYTMQNLVFSMLGAGLFNGIIQVPVGAWGRASTNALRQAEFRDVSSSLAFKTADAGAMNKLIPGTDEGPKQLRKLALLEIQDRVLVRAAVAKDLGETIQDPSLAGAAPAARGATFRADLPNKFVPPGEKHRAFFLRDAQRGLDEDLYFMTRSEDRTFRRGFDDFVAKQKQESKAARKAKKTKALREEEAALKTSVKGTKATKRLARKAKERISEGRVDLDDETLEGFIDGGVNLRGVDPDELDFSPNANATREVEVTMDSALASSKALDEVGVKAGYPEVRELDRTKHLMKSLEMRLAATKVALGDTLKGRPVNVNFLMREAVALDMHNRGVITAAEYKDLMTTISKEHKAYVEAPHSGILASDRIEVVSDTEVQARALGEQAKFAEGAEEIDGVVTQIDDQAKSLDYDLEADERFSQLKKSFDDLGEQEATFKKENTQKGMETLARCMAGGRQ